MTAQIAILNKSAIALATDSAVTIDGSRNRKTYNTVNKLFTLSKYAPVGIMFYGNAEFMNVPWETIVKIHRHHLATKTFPLLEDYATHFLEFLQAASDIFPPEQQQRYLEIRLIHYLSSIRKDTDDRVSEAFKAGKQVTPTMVQNTFQQVLKLYCNHFRSQTELPQFDRKYKKTFLSKHLKIIDKLASDILQAHPRSPMDNARIRFVAYSMITRADFSGPYSGVVIAGFGENDHFPKLRSFRLGGIVDGIMKYTPDKNAEVSFKNEASITPFAQADMVSEFMEGVHPSFVEFFQARLSEIFRILPGEILKCVPPIAPATSHACQNKLNTMFEQLLNDLNRDQKRFRREHHISPVIDTVAVLPKDELATMAEALVNLTQFRQKITLQTETVGGPIDVAVISKGDGFIWIRRKHYFDVALNPYFVHNYFRNTEKEI